MVYIIASLTAALCFVVNRILVRLLGGMTVISLGPLVEESAKTLLPYVLGADILATHSLFGVIEAGYDWFLSPDNKVTAALFSIAGHFLFGLTAVMLLKLSGYVPVAILGSAAVHLVWNILAIRLYSGG